MDSLGMLAHIAASDVPTAIADAVATRATTGARPQAVAAVAASAAGEKRRRLTGVEKAKAAIAEAVEKQAAATARLAEARAAAEKSSSKKAQDAFVKAKKHYEKQLEASAAADKVYYEAVDKAKSKAKEAAEKAAAAEELAARNVPLSELGQVTLVQIKMVMEPLFRNTSDTTASVWNELHARFMARVSSGELPASDGRSSEALQRKYNEELSYYRVWCSTANRAMVQSGVSVRATC